MQCFSSFGISTLFWFANFQINATLFHCFQVGFQVFPLASGLLAHGRSRDFFSTPLDHYFTLGQQLLELQEVPIQVFARSRKMVIPITHQSLVKNRDFNHSPITISNGDSNHSPITNQITLHNFLGSNFDYYISNKYSFSIITVGQSASQSILTYVSEKYCLQSIIQGTEILYLMQISVLDANFCTWCKFLYLTTKSKQQMFSC